jgi:hypothetical protein
MGINRETLELLHMYSPAGQPPRLMLELGNQLFDAAVCNIYKLQSRVAKPYFVKEGWQHISVDINGQDGAVPLNLGMLLNERYDADMVTNFGTSEHVANQYNCFKNIHNFTKPNGVMLHVLPEVGHWPRHCKYYYTHEFFKYLAAVNGYDILLIKTLTSLDNLIFAGLVKKSNSEFCSDAAALLKHIAVTSTVDPQSYTKE